MTLQLLLTHYKESPETVKRMLDSIDEQLDYVDLSKFFVSIVSDGIENVLPQDTFAGYRYHIEYEACEHRGARFARNYLLENASADYVMFCDIDDCFIGKTGIFQFFEKMESSPDVITSPIFMEYPDGTGNLALRTIPSGNAVWLGGDAFRLAYLRENGIAFDEVLNYGEKYFLWQAFNFTNRIAYVTTKAYVYKYNVGSLSRSEPHFRIKNLYKFFGTIELLIERLKNLGKSELLKKLVSESVAFAYTSYYSVWLNNSGADSDDVDKAKDDLRRFIKACTLDICKVQQGSLKLNLVCQLIQTPTVQKLTFDSMLEWVDEIWLEY